MSGVRYTQADDNALVRGRQRSVSFEDLAAMLGRSRDAVRDRHAWLIGQRSSRPGDRSNSEDRRPRQLTPDDTPIHAPEKPQDDGWMVARLIEAGGFSRESFWSARP